jgi:hypothetical protein
MTKANAITRLASLISLSITITALATVLDDVKLDISTTKFLCWGEASLKTRADQAAHLQINLIEQPQAAPAGRRRYPLLAADSRERRAARRQANRNFRRE